MSTLAASFGIEGFLSWHIFMWSICIGLAVYGFYWYGFGRFKILKNLGIDGPKPLPFIGHLADLKRHKFQIHKYFDEYVKTYGKCFGFYFLGFPAMCVTDPDMLRQIFVKDFAKFHDREIFGNLPEPLASFLTIVKGERWKFIRNTLTPTFSSGKLKPMCGMMNEIVDTLIGKCRAAANKGSSVDFAKLQQGLTMEIILSAAFGVQAQTQTDPNDPLTAKAKQAMQNPRWLTFLSLLPGANKFIRYIPYGFKYLTEPMVEVAKTIIKQRKSIGFQGRKDLLQLMLDAQKEPDKEGRRLTDDEVVAQALVFLLAGYDSSATTIALTCYYLAAYQDVQEKMYQEVHKHFQDNEVPDYESVQKLEYMDQVINEVLRLNPPGFMTLRSCNEDCVVKGVPFKRGFIVVTPVYSVHRDPKFYENPETFDPERFRPEAKSKRDPLTFLPFGHGPRNCIGARFAQMEMKIVLTRIMQEFKLDVCESAQMPPKVMAHGTLTVRDPINLKVTLRNP